MLPPLPCSGRRRSRPHLLSQVRCDLHRLVFASHTVLGQLFLRESDPLLSKHELHLRRRHSAARRLALAAALAITDKCILAPRLTFRTAHGAIHALQLGSFCSARSCRRLLIEGAAGSVPPLPTGSRCWHGADQSFIIPALRRIHGRVRGASGGLHGHPTQLRPLLLRNEAQPAHQAGRSDRGDHCAGRRQRLTEPSLRGRSLRLAAALPTAAAPDGRRRGRGPENSSSHRAAVAS